MAEIKKSNIYTRTGDSGSTSLVDGTRIPKNDPRIEAYGSVDELNSWLGVVISHLPAESIDREVFTNIQRHLFAIGSCLAAGSPEMEARLRPDLSVALAALEAEIDRIDSTLPRHNRFILPQGTQASGAAQVARTVCRRAERRIIDISDRGDYTALIRYINRLSDYLFVAARHFNLIEGVGETYWEP